jgi:MFS family permease
MLIWSTQIVSILASSMTAFGLSLWLFERTERATDMGIMQICFILPFLLFSPFAGALVDRYNRKLMMAMSDFFAAGSTAAILALYATGSLAEWHLYAAAALNGVGNCFQWPAYTAAISTMMPKEQYTRANSLSGIMEAGPQVFAPMAAAAAMPVLGLGGLMLLDLATFALALGALSLVRIPAPPPVPEAPAEKRSLLAVGFKYIFSKPPLLALLCVFLFANFFAGFSHALQVPMILGRTGHDRWILGFTQSAFAVGGIVGGLAIGAWGGFKDRVKGVLIGIFALAAAGSVAFALSTSLWVWVSCAVAVGIGGALANASSQSIWQSKVPAAMQGRVFSARRMIAWFTGPLVPAIACPLADYVFEPAMASGAAPSIARSLFGTGLGSGMALLIALSGLVALAVPLVAWGIPLVRKVDELIPDCDQTAPETAAQES